MKLSILIPTIPEREDKLKRLEAKLSRQETEDVEILIITEHALVNGGPAIGANRNTLLKAATGDYVCFVDDDDDVSDNYIKLILDALKDNPDVVGIKGHYICGNCPPELFVHSLKYDNWFTDKGVHYRCPNHLNPVRRELALKVMYPEIQLGEDKEYSMNLKQHLKTEVMIEDVIYYYLK